MRRHTANDAARTSLLAVLLAVACLQSGASAAPRLEVRPRRVDFGAVEQGTKKRKVFRLRNAGDEVLVIEQIRPSCAECVADEVQPGRLAPGEELDFPVTYRAAAVPGKYTAHVTFHTNDPVEPLKRIYLDVEITPRKAAPRIEVEPAGIDLGIVLVNEPARRVLRVRNGGKAALRLSELVSGPLVSLPDLPVRELAPGEGCELPFVVQSARAGIIRTYLTIATNDPESRTLTVPVYGYAASAEQLERATRGIIIVPQRSGDRTPRLHALRVTNNQDAPARLREAGRPEGAGLDLAPGQSGTLPVRADGGAGEVRLLIRITLPVTTESTDRSRGEGP